MRFGRPGSILALASALGAPGCTGSPAELRLASPVSAPGPAREPERRRLPPEEQPPDVLFQYNAGAPLAGPPGIAGDGSLVAGTIDGFLHALRPDGSFRWSYTLRGRVIGRPVLTPDGVALISAERNGLYALDPKGTLLWVTAVPAGITSAPVLDADGKIWVATNDGTLLGFSRRGGGIAGFARIGRAPAVGPVLLDSGEVAVANADGVVRVSGRLGRAEQLASGAPLRELRAGPHGLFALGKNGLVRFATRPLEERWSRPFVAEIACTGEAIVGFEKGAARWLSPAGEPGASVALPRSVTAAPSCLDTGGLLLASDDGVLHRLEPNGVTARRSIPAGAVLSVDRTPAGLALLSYRDGRLVAVALPQ